jgi:uncharacterized protein DUF5655
MTAVWTCPKCHRAFRRIRQRHACGLGSRAALLRGRPSDLVLLYGSLEDTVRSFGEVEVVTRERYALFRTTRIFADLTVMRDALRVVVHLDREARVPCFFKVQRESPNRVAHVTLLRSAPELRTVVPYLKEAYRLAASEEMAGNRSRTRTRGR